MSRSQQDVFSLAGKLILVTGASSGIGRAIAMCCAEMGATLVVCGRNEARLQQTLASLAGEGHQSLAFDLQNLQQCEQAFDALPRLDGIVHCAGVRSLKLCKQITAEDIDAQMDVNFKGPVLLQSMLLAKKKINSGASIVFIASLAYAAAGIGNAIYSATKGALISYANCLKLELAPRKIRVNCISPAMIKTEMITRDGISEEMLEADQASYLFKSYGEPSDVANLAVYLLSDASKWMTGTNVEITGGAPKI